MSISQDLRTKIEQRINANPEATDGKISESVRYKDEATGKFKRAGADLVKRVREEMNCSSQQPESDQSVPSGENQNLDMFNMALPASEALYEADTVQKIRDWLSNNSHSPKSGEAMFWPEYFVRQQLSISQDEFRAALNSDELLPHEVKIKGTIYLSHDQQEVMKVRQRKLRG